MYSIQDDCMHEIYTDILIDVYARQLLRLIFDNTVETALIYSECQGCQHLSSSQSNHDVCCLNPSQQIIVCFHDALRVLNEDVISPNFLESVSHSYMLASVTSDCERSHLLNSAWRKSSWLRQAKVEKEIISRMMSLKHFE